MALVSTVSIGIVDHNGDRKPIPLYIPATVTLAALATILDSTLNALDDAIDGKIDSVSVNLALALPSGLKGAAVDPGQDVHNGANLTYDPADTDFAFSIYVPTWKEAGFAGSNALETGVYGAAQAMLVTDNWTDRDGNTFDAFIKGSKVRRK